jgi:hypothetical protein
MSRVSSAASTLPIHFFQEWIEPSLRPSVSSPSQWHYLCMVNARHRGLFRLANGEQIDTCHVTARKMKKLALKVVAS